MNHEYLPTVQCPCCKFFYIIKCSHAESASEADNANIEFKSAEYFQLRMIPSKEGQGA